MTFSRDGGLLALGLGNGGLRILSGQTWEVVAEMRHAKRVGGRSCRPMPAWQHAATQPRDCCPWPQAGFWVRSGMQCALPPHADLMLTADALC